MIAFFSVFLRFCVGCVCVCVRLCTCTFLNFYFLICVILCGCYCTLCFYMCSLTVYLCACVNVLHFAARWGRNQLWRRRLIGFGPRPVSSSPVVTPGGRSGGGWRFNAEVKSWNSNHCFDTTVEGRGRLHGVCVCGMFVAVCVFIFCLCMSLHECLLIVCIHASQQTVLLIWLNQSEEASTCWWVEGLYVCVNLHEPTAQWTRRCGFI